MALATRQCLLVIILVVAVMTIPAGGYFSMIYDCDPHPQWLSTPNGSAFRASLAPLLAALPSAAAPTGFASLRSDNGRAFVRGLCFGESPQPHDCRECLSISVDWIDPCNGSRHAGFWSGGCFLAYADTTNASSWEDKEFFTSSFDYSGGVSNYYPDFYDAQRLVDLAQSLAPRAANSNSGRMVAAAQANSSVRALAQCLENVTAADCARCLERSAQDVPQCLRVGGYEREGVQSAGVANIFSYTCYLRLEIFGPMRPMGKGARLRKKMRDHLAVVLVVAVAIVVVIVGAALLVLKRIRTRKRKAQAATHAPS